MVKVNFKYAIKFHKKYFATAVFKRVKKKTLKVESKFSYQQPDASSMGYVMC